MLRGCLPQFFASTSCSSDAESFNQFPASASTGFFRNSHQCTSRVVYCLNLLELEHFVFEFCFGNTGIGFFIWKNKNSATNISEESQIEQLTITGSKPIQTPRSPSRPYCVTELNSKKQTKSKPRQFNTKHYKIFLRATNGVLQNQGPFSVPKSHNHPPCP